MDIVNRALESLKIQYESNIDENNIITEERDTMVSSLVEELESLTEDDFKDIETFFTEDLNLSQLSQQIIALLRMVLSSGALGKLKIREEIDMNDVYPIVEQFVLNLNSENDEI